MFFSHLKKKKIYTLNKNKKFIFGKQCIFFVRLFTGKLNQTYKCNIILETDVMLLTISFLRTPIIKLKEFCQTSCTVTNPGTVGPSPDPPSASTHITLVSVVLEHDRYLHISHHIVTLNAFLFTHSMHGVRESAQWRATQKI